MTNDPWSPDTPTIEKPEWLTSEIEAQLKLNNYPVNKDGMLMLWKEWQHHLKEAKELEMQYRKICTAFLVPAKTEGTTNVELGKGYTAKVVNKYNYNLNGDNDKVWSTLDKISAIGNEGKFIADRLVSWTPSFLKTEYTTLQEEADKGNPTAQQILKIVNDELIVITEGAPTLEIKEPKVKK